MRRWSALAFAAAVLIAQHSNAAVKTIVLQQGVDGYTGCMTAEMRVPGEESREPPAGRDVLAVAGG